MHGETSSAPRRADGRGVPIFSRRAGADSRPFHCFGGEAHRWGLERKAFVVVIDGQLVDEGRYLQERCKRCELQRPFYQILPGTGVPL